MTGKTSRAIRILRLFAQALLLLSNEDHSRSRLPRCLPIVLARQGRASRAVHWDSNDIPAQSKPGRETKFESAVASES